MKTLIRKIRAACAVAQLLAFGRRQEFCNVAEGFHRDGQTTLIADAAIPSLYLLVKAGSDALHVNLCTAADRPRGVAQDKVAAGDYLKVALLGKGPTKPMQGGGAIPANTLVMPTAAGQVLAVPAAGTGNGGTYWVVGESNTACAGAGEQLEVLDCFPYQLVVAN